MVSALFSKSHGATKVIYSGCVSLVLLGALWCSFDGGLEASKAISAKPGMSEARAQSQPPLVASFGKLPLSFEVNQGQTDARVKFLSHGHGYALFLTGDEAVLELQESGVRSQESGAEFSRSMRNGGLRRTTDKGPRTTDVLRLRLVQANQHAAVLGAQELPGKVNYFIGNDPKKWRVNVPTYAQVRYQDVYPGVDLIYYGNQGGQLEYDFIVAPGADPSAITLQVAAEGEPPLRIDARGELVIPAKGGEVRFHQPVVYQPAADSSLVTRPSLPVQGHFRLEAQNRVRFALGPYDHSRPLVIDPALTFSTYLGGAGVVDSGSGGSAVAIDYSGAVYITGSTTQTDFPTVNPLQPSLDGGADVFVSKLTPTGSAFVFSTFLGGSGADVGYAIAVDTGGSIYLTGATSSFDFPVVHALQASPKSAGAHAFVTKMNTIGSALVYSTYLSGSSNDIGSGIAVDVGGEATVTGVTHSADFPTFNPIQANPTGAFVSKLNGTGSAFIYSTYLGGGSGTTANAVALDSSGNAYITGSSAQNFPVTPGAYQTSCTKVGPATNCAYVTEVNAAGTVLVYASYLSGSNNDEGGSIAVDASGNAYVTGFTTSANFPTVNPVQGTFTGVMDAFVSKLNATGTALLYSTFLGGSESGEGLALSLGNAIAIDSSRNAYVTGLTNAMDFPLANPIQTTNNANSPAGPETAFVAELNAAGSALVYSTYLGGNIYDTGNGIAVNSSGDAWVIGSTSSTDFPMVNPLKATNTDTWTDQTVVFLAELSLGPVPAVSFSAPALSFPATFLKVTSPQQSVTLTNLGNASLNIAGMVASGDFALVTTATSCPYLGGTLKPLANCTIDVTFTPTVAGTRTGNVAITDNAGGSPQAVQLSGIGSATVAVTVSPKSLSFGNQLLGTLSAPQGVTVTNPGSVAISITSLSISNGWTETDNCLPAIPAGLNCNIRVVFAPTVGGNLSGAITITDDANNSPQTVSLSGTALAPVVTLSAMSLSFPAQAPSTTSAPQTILLTNTGNGALTPLTLSTSGDFAQTNNCTVPIDPGIACTIGVTFTPTAAGTRTGTLTLTDNASNSPQTVTLTGTGQGAMASLSTTSLTFAGQAISTQSVPQTITLTNPGGLALTPLTISTSGDFAQTNTCAGSVAAGANCTISVTFTPTASGAQTGTLTITDNASNSPQTVTLSGTGLGPVVSLSATSLTFAAQTVSTQSGPQTITLTNTGNAALTSLAIARSGPFAETNTCAASLAGGASCTIRVTFSPLGAGSQSGTITVTDNSPNSPQTIALSGTGMDFAFSTSTPSQSVNAGQTANYSFEVAPESGFSQTVNLVCTGAPALATCTLSATQVTLVGSTPNAGLVTMAVTTTAPSTTMLPPPAGKFLPPGFTGLGRVFWLYGLLGLASATLLAAARKRRAAYLLGVCLLLAMLWCACGGGSSTPAPKTIPGTPSGTYTMAVTGTGASTPTLTHTINFTLTVN